MSNALPHDDYIDRQAALPVSRPPTALVPLAPIRSPLRATTGEALRRRMDALRMSNAERHAAVHALLLGRDISNVLLHVGRRLRRGMGARAGEPHLRYASFRNLVPVRRARFIAEKTPPLV